MGEPKVRDLRRSALTVEEAESLLARAEAAEAALRRINEIRNSIIGAQAVNWSEHVYPLVAALEEAGVAGMPYPEARENMGTLLTRAETAETALAEVRRALNLVRGCYAGLAALPDPETVFAVWDSGARSLFSGMENPALFTRREAEAELTRLTQDADVNSYEIGALLHALGRSRG